MDLFEKYNIQFEYTTGSITHTKCMGRIRLLSLHDCPPKRGEEKWYYYFPVQAAHKLKIKVHRRLILVAGFVMIRMPRSNGLSVFPVTNPGRILVLL